MTAEEQIARIIEADVEAFVADVEESESNIVAFVSVGTAGSVGTVEAAAATKRFAERVATDGRRS